MFKEMSWQEKLLAFSSALMVMVLIIKDQLIPPFILLFALSTIPFWKGPKHIVSKRVVFPMIALFLLYAISFLFVVNKASGILQLTTRLSFLIFPVLALLMSNGGKYARLGLKWGFILGSGISMLFSLVRAIVIEGGFSGEAFMSNVYGLNMHPSYLALIFLFASALLFLDSSTSKVIKVGRWAFLGLTVISLFYLRSLGAFVCIAAIFTALPIWKTLKTKNWKWLLTLPVYGLLFFVGLKSSDRISNDVAASLNSVGVWAESPSQFIEKNVNNIESNTVRLVVWTISTNMIYENPFGVGLGDENDLLMREYYKHGYSGYAERRLNPHQQFLQTGISIGWLGIIVLLTLFVSLIIASYRTNDLALYIGAICISVSCLFESMLERQVGVIFLSILLFYIAMVRFKQQTSKSVE